MSSKEVKAVKQVGREDRPGSGETGKQERKYSQTSRQEVK